MDANQLVLGYWAIRGLGQPLRALLHYVGLPFTDKLYTDANEWFGKDRPAFNSPLANLPYLKDGDKVTRCSRKGRFRVRRHILLHRTQGQPARAGREGWRTAGATGSSQRSHQRFQNEIHRRCLR